MRLIKYKIWPFMQLRSLLLFYRHIGLKESDIFIASYPKSGNTWLRFILASIITGDEVDFDNVADIIPEVERHRSKGFILAGGKKLIKTHEMWRPEYKKSVYIIRNGRDVAISYYFFQKSLGLFNGSFSEFLKLFAEARTDGYGGWKKNVESWFCQHKKEPKTVLVIKYVDMLEDIFDVLQKVVNFLGLKTSDERIGWAIDTNSASYMREKEQNSITETDLSRRFNIPFVRKASSGQWKQYFSRDDIELFNEKMGQLNNSLEYCE